MNENTVSVVAWAIAALCMVGVLSIAGVRCTQIERDTFKVCVEHHSPLECTAARRSQ
jgi:hypothetical protein